MLVEAAKVGEIALGGMKRVDFGTQEIVVCNCGGTYYAVVRRCGHMSAPLEMGALDGTILTCAMHHVQFDVTTGEALSQPVPEYHEEPLPEQWGKSMQYLQMLMEHIRVCDIKSLPVQLDNGTIKIGIDL